MPEELNLSEKINCDIYTFLQLIIKGKINNNDVCSYIKKRKTHHLINIHFINRVYQEQLDMLWDYFVQGLSEQLIYDNDIKKIIDSLFFTIYNFNNEEIVECINEQYSSLHPYILYSLIKKCFQNLSLLKNKDNLFNIFESLLIALINKGCINSYKLFFKLNLPVLNSIYDLPEANKKCFEILMYAYSVWHGRYAQDNKDMLFLFLEFEKMFKNSKDKPSYKIFFNVDDNMRMNTYIYAYKKVNEDYSSTFCKGIKYIVGEIYESISDLNPLEDNSYGLNCWTLSNCKDFGIKGKILKVKININDITYCNLFDGKIRCSKFKVIEEV